MEMPIIWEVVVYIMFAVFGVEVLGWFFRWKWVATLGLPFTFVDETDFREAISIDEADELIEEARSFSAPLVRIARVTRKIGNGFALSPIFSSFGARRSTFFNSFAGVAVSGFLTATPAAGGTRIRAIGHVRPAPIILSIGFVLMNLLPAPWGLGGPPEMAAFAAVASVLMYGIVFALNRRELRMEVARLQDLLFESAA